MPCLGPYKDHFSDREKIHQLALKGVPTRMGHSEAQDAIKTSVCHRQVAGFSESVLSYRHAAHLSV